MGTPGGCVRPECKRRCAERLLQSVDAVATAILPGYNADKASQDAFFASLLERSVDEHGQQSYVLGGVRVCYHAIIKALRIHWRRGQRLRQGVPDLRHTSRPVGGKGGKSRDSYLKVYGHLWRRHTPAL